MRSANATARIDLDTNFLGRFTIKIAFGKIGMEVLLYDNQEREYAGSWPICMYPIELGTLEKVRRRAEEVLGQRKEDEA